MIFEVFTVGTDGVGLDEWTVYYRSSANIPEQFKTKLFAQFDETFRNYSDSKFDPHSYLVVTWFLEKDLADPSDLSQLSVSQNKIDDKYNYCN